MEEWFEHSPLLEEIMLFLPPEDVFVDFRRVHTSWNRTVQSESFCKYYYEKAVCKRNESFWRVKESVIENSSGEDVVDFMCVPQVLTLLESCFATYMYIRKLDMYCKLLSMIAFSNRKKLLKNRQVLRYLPSLTDQQETKLYHTLSKWNLTNLLREEFIIYEPEHVPKSFIFFRDDGLPFIYSDHSTKRCIEDALFLNGIKFAQGLGIVNGIVDRNVLYQFIYGVPSCEYDLEFCDNDMLIIMDYFTIITPKLLHRLKIRNLSKNSHQHEQEEEYQMKYDQFVPTWRGLDGTDI